VTKIIYFYLLIFLYQIVFLIFVKNHTKQIFLVITVLFLIISYQNLNISLSEEVTRQSNSANDLLFENDISDFPVAVYSNFGFNNSHFVFDYFVQNKIDEIITSFYIHHEAPHLIDLNSVISPENWIFHYSTDNDYGWNFIYWFLDPNIDPIQFGLKQNQTFHFQTSFPFNVEGVMVANSVWSLGGLEGLPDSYSNPIQGLLYNSSMYVNLYDNYPIGLSDIPTIVQSPQTCTFGLNTDLLRYENHNPIPIEIQNTPNNYTKKINTHEVLQGWTTKPNMGCFSTAIGYSLGWWGENGIKPQLSDNSTNNATEVPNPIDVKDFDEMLKLIEELLALTNTTETKGTNINNVIEGLRQFFKKYNLPLNLTYYWFGNPMDGQSGQPNPRTIIDEFMNKREDVTITVAYNGAEHALTVVGINKTKDEKCGYKISVLDPDSGNVIETCMNEQYYDQNKKKYTDTPTGNITYGNIMYKGKNRIITGMIAISPTSPIVDVEVKTENNTNSSLFSLSSKILKYSYLVKPTDGFGALIDTFVLNTSISDFNLFSNFILPNNWALTPIMNESGYYSLFFHNGLFNGKNATHLGSSGFEFSFTVQSTSSNQGIWYTTHSGLAILDDTVEDSGKILVPSDQLQTTSDLITTTESLGTTITSDTNTTTILPNNVTSTNGFSSILSYLPLYELISITVILVLLIRRNKSLNFSRIINEI
jgi:hypothetical protein